MSTQFRRLLFLLLTFWLASIGLSSTSAENESDFWQKIARGDYTTAADNAANLGHRKTFYYALAAVSAQNSFEYSKFQIYHNSFANRGSMIKLKSELQTWGKIYAKEPQVMLFIEMVFNNYPQIKYGNSAAWFKNTEPRLSQNAFFQNYRGLNELSHKNFVIAEKYFQKAIALKPDYPEPYLNLATVLLKENKFDQAFETFETALLKCPRVPDYFYSSLASLISTEVRLKIQPNKGQPRIIIAPAIRSSFLERLKTIGAASSPHLVRLAEYYAIKGNPDSAENILEAISEELGDSDLYYYVLMHIQNLRGQEELMLLSARLLLKNDQLDYLRLQKAGEILFYYRNHEQARAFFENSLSLANPEDDRALFELNKNIGACYYYEKDYSKTIEYLEKAVSYNLTDTDTLVNLGLLYQNSGNKTKAKEFFIRALKSTKNPLKQKEINESFNKLK